MNSEKITMEVNIAGEIFSLIVPFSRQDAVRKTEAELGSLYRMWSREMPGKTPRELLAMMAYKFASAYFDLFDQHEEETEEAEQLLESVSRMCGGENAHGDDPSQFSEFPEY